MTMMTTSRSKTNRVRAVYPDSAVLFDLPENATLGQLAMMLAAVGRGHGSPLRVEVAVKPTALSL